MNYKARVGESSVTGDLWKAWRLGWRMIFLVLEYRLGLVRRERTQWSEPVDSTTGELVAGDPRDTAQSLSALATILHGRGPQGRTDHRESESVSREDRAM